MIENVEEGLLPNERFKTLCQECVVALVKKDSEERGDLDKEFFIVLENCHLIVLDARGETLGITKADGFRSCTPENAKEFPGDVLAKMGELLNRPKSYQQLEEDACRNINDANTFQKMADAFHESGQHDRVIALCDRILADKALRLERKSDLRFTRLKALSSSNRADRMFDEEWRLKVVTEAESLLIELGGERGADIGSILSHSLSCVFDSRACLNASVARIAKAAESLPEERKRPVMEVVTNLIKEVNEGVKEMEATLEQLMKEAKEKQEEDKVNLLIGLYAAHLGNAELAVKHLAQDDELLRPLYEAAKKRLK